MDMKYESLTTKNPSRLNHPLRAGFTILELLIVISIMAIIGGVGFASYTQFNSRQTLEQASLDMKSGVDEAKFNAVSRVKPSTCSGKVLDGYQVVICGAAGNQCSNSANLYEIRAVCVAAAVTTTPVVSFKKRPSSVSTAIASNECGLTANNNIVLFNSQTGAANTTCRIVLTESSTGNTRTVCVSNGGGVSVKNGTPGC